MDTPAGEAEDQAWCIAIADRIGRGDTEAEGLLVSRLEPGLRMILRARCQHDRSLVPDLCQDTLMIVLRRLRERSLEDTSRIAAFAAQTARQLAFDALRRTQGRKTLFDSAVVEHAQVAAPDDDSAERASVVAIVARLLAELSSDRDREILKRFYLLEQDKTDICRHLNMASGAFDQVVFRARARLRDLLAARGLRGHDLLCVPFLGVPRSWRI